MTQETNYAATDRAAINVDLNLEHRQKGLRYSTYKSVLMALTLSVTPATKIKGHFRQLSTAQAVYDDRLHGGWSSGAADQRQEQCERNRRGESEARLLRMGYKSQGLNGWRYNLAGQRRATPARPAWRRCATFANMTTTSRISISPTIHFRRQRLPTPAAGLEWNYKNLVSGYQIAMTMPEKLQPGPLAGRISLFAPVSLFFFFFLMLIITTLRGIELHPMNYFFLAAAFFSFHLLLAYLVDHVSIHLAFAICSAVSVFLVVSYLRLVVGARFATREAALAQFIYLVAFSYAFFLKGFTGLAITIGSITTLFVVMQVTGKIRWTEKFAPRSLTPELAPPTPTPVTTQA